MGFWRTTFRNLAASLLLFGAAAVLLAFAAGTDGPIVLRLLIQFPLLMLFAAIVLFLINLVAAFVGMVVTNSLWAAVLVAAVLGWVAVGSPPQQFGGLGYHPLLKPAFAGASGLPWLVTWLIAANLLPNWFGRGS
jgi:hypothetical protein